MVILHALKAGRVIDKSLFSRENRTYPPSLTTSQGEMYHGTKADLMHCLLKLIDTQPDAPDSPTRIIIDLSFLIQMLKPGASVTISDYIHGVIKAYVKSLLLQYIRVDLLVDVYIPKSLKAPLRLTRGQGERKRVKLTTKVPKNFQSFLRVDEHKTELNGLIAA